MHTCLLRGYQSVTETNTWLRSLALLLRCSMLSSRSKFLINLKKTWSWGLGSIQVRVVLCTSLCSGWEEKKLWQILCRWKSHCEENVIWMHQDSEQNAFCETFLQMVLTFSSARLLTLFLTEFLRDRVDANVFTKTERKQYFSASDADSKM